MLGFEWLAIRGRAALREAGEARAEARRLCDSLERFRSVAAGAGAVAAVPVVLRTDAAGAIVASSEAVARWLNVPVDHLVGLRLLHFVARRDTRSFRAMVKTLGHPGPEGASGEVVVHFRPRHGRPQLVRASVARAAPNVFEWILSTVGSATR